jgi:hypothetical protein
MIWIMAVMWICLIVLLIVLAAEFWEWWSNH